jgi:hypothetical protein
MKSRRTYLVLFAILAGLALAASAMSPFPPPGIHGRYNYNSMLAYCDSRPVCLHEIGHALDQAAGYPSQGKAFGDALNIHLAVAFHSEPDELSMQILRELTGHADGYRGLSELYANLFMSAGGQEENMPSDLRPFYDWQLAGRLVGQLRDGQTLYWLGE